MDPLMLSRLQFAAASFFHFLFVPLTLGLSFLVALMETKYVRTGDETYLKMTKFWGKLFLINFAIGVVTGITLEFQFGTNWSRYSTYVGDIFGSLLAIEATASFFLESTFIAVWVFGWQKLSRKAHAGVAWLIFLGSNLSAVWILLANGWMQNPVGYVIRNGRAELDDFMAVLTNPFGWGQFFHTLSGAYVLAAFFVMAVSCYHLRKKQHMDFFKKSFQFAAPMALIASIVVAGQGHHHGNQVAELQPAKLAAMEAHWETSTYAPMSLFVIPGENGSNPVEFLEIPGLLSLLAFNDPSHEVIGLNDIPEDERPPVAITFWAFRIMVGLGTVMLVLSALAWYRRKDIENRPMLMRALLFSLPMPYIALEAGWTVAEVGRQPWIVQGIMKTADAVSPALTTGQVGFTFFMILAIYTVLGAAGYFLIATHAKKGPKE